MRKASQILARHCPIPHPIRESDEEYGDYEYYVPMKDALAAIKDAMGEEDRKPDLTPLQAVGLLLVTIFSSPLIFVFGGMGAIFDNFETTLSRVKLNQD